MQRKSVLAVAMLILIVGQFVVPAELEAGSFFVEVMFGETVADYQMVSWPINPGVDPKIQLFNQLGPYDINIWRFFRWCPVYDRYIEGPEEPLFPPPL